MPAIVTSAFGWIAAHPIEFGAWLYALAHVIVGMVPSRYHAAEYIGGVLRVLDKVTAITPPDRPGTFQVPPAVRVVLGIVTGAVRASQPPPAPAQPPPPVGPNPGGL